MSEDLTPAQKTYRERLRRLVDYDRRLEALRRTPEYRLERFLDKFVGFRFNVRINERKGQKKP